MARRGDAVTAAAGPPAVTDQERWASAKLLTFFRARTGRWSTPTGQAWQPALLIEAAVNAYERGRDPVYLRVIERSFARYRGRRSHFYDHDGWYANAWLRAYDVTGDPGYLAEAEEIFAGLTLGWDARRGGVWWTDERTDKTALTTGLFLLAAARLSRRAGDERAGDRRAGGALAAGRYGGGGAGDGIGPGGYGQWAGRAWAWFDASGLINGAGLVDEALPAPTGGPGDRDAGGAGGTAGDDGAGDDGAGGAGGGDGGTRWTHTQGVLISALVELWRGTGEAGPLARAHRIAAATTTTLVHPGGILRESVEPFTEHKEAHGFKGVFAQGLARLYAADPGAGAGYATFLRANADAVWRHARHPRRGIGFSWLGPVGWVTGATHAAGCLLLSHVAQIDGAQVNAPVNGAQTGGSRVGGGAGPAGPKCQTPPA